MTDTSSTSARPRARRLQFSLRLLLLAFTAFAIGFPIWYRWPYEEISWRSPPGSPNEAQQITTWQRQWGGGKLKHGLQRFVRDGVNEETTTYRNGLRHGPYESKNIRGLFVNDLKEGIWTAPDRTATWRQGKLHGPYELRYLHPDKPRTFQLVFADGRLIHLNGKPAAGRLFDLMESDVIEPRTRNELGKLTQLDVIEMPLKDIVLYLTELHGIPIVLDQSLAPNADMPITENLRGIELSSALTVITAPHGLACDYRYGCLVITTADDAKDWHDPTGVSEIKPPNQTALARAWNEPASIDAFERPLAGYLDYLEQRLAIQIDTTRIQPTAEQPAFLSITHRIKGIPFQHLLGQLLYKTGCRCRLEGETLVILPPENEPTQ